MSSVPFSSASTSSGPSGEREDVARLRGWIEEARAAVAFTGAGLSTECGVPDFRSPDSPWRVNKPIPFDVFVASEAARLEAWRRKFAMDDLYAGARPGRGHLALARLAEAGKLRGVITQNIDDLHQASGLTVDRVVELHGNGTYAACLVCARRHELDWCRAVFVREGASPRCEACGGLVKSATISFGQAMPAEAMRRAREWTLESDLFIVLGSSLVVYPAAALPALAKSRGARLVIVNREPTELDAIADLVVNDDIGAVIGSFGA